MIPVLLHSRRRKTFQNEIQKENKSSNQLFFTVFKYVTLSFIIVCFYKQKYTHLFKKNTMYIMETLRATEFLMWEGGNAFHLTQPPYHCEKLQVISYKK